VIGSIAEENLNYSAESKDTTPNRHLFYQKVNKKSLENILKDWPRRKSTKEGVKEKRQLQCFESII
jgi:hypothetical protein